MFMTAWGFEARHCPTLLNEIKKTKLQTYTAPQAGINILLWPGEFCYKLSVSCLIVVSAILCPNAVTILDTLDVFLLLLSALHAVTYVEKTPCIVDEC